MKRILIRETINQIGQTILLKGWVNIRRDHGKLIFLDLRDRTGLIQLVVNPKVSAEAHATANDVRSEFVLEIEGLVKERDAKQDLRHRSPYPIEPGALPRSGDASISPPYPPHADVCTEA